MKSRKKIWNREKKIKIEKKTSEWRKIFQLREKYFRIERTVSESRNIFFTKIEKKSLELNVFTTFLQNSFIACVRLVTVKSCFAQNVALKLEMNIISVLHVGIKQSLS